MGDAFELYDHDGKGRITPSELRGTIMSLNGVVDPSQIVNVLRLFPEEGATLKEFVEVYCTALFGSGFPSLHDFKAVFNVFDSDARTAHNLQEFKDIFLHYSPVDLPEKRVEELIFIDESHDDDDLNGADCQLRASAIQRNPEALARKFVQVLDAYSQANDLAEDRARSFVF